MNYNDIDNLMDCVLEFHIRIKSDLDSVNEAMSVMSKDTRTIFEEYKNNDSTIKLIRLAQSALSDLAKVENQEEQIALGINLFGVQFEDLY